MVDFIQTVLILSFTNSIKFAHCNTEMAIDNIRIETFINPKLSQAGRKLMCSCETVVISKSDINFSWQLPSVIFSEHFSKRKLQSICNALIILPPETDLPHFLADVKRFISINYANIQLVVLFLQDFPLDFFPWMKSIQKDFLVVGKVGGKEKIFEYNSGADGDGKNDFQRTLHRQEITIGYSTIRPYFVVDESLRQKNGTLPTMYMNPENIDSVRNYFHGIESEMIKILVETYEISFTLLSSSFGMELPNGTWTGKFAFLVERKVDFLVACLPGNYRRNTIGDYSTQMYMIRFTLASTKPGPLPSYQAPFRPFPFATWFILLLSTAIIGPLTWWVTKSHYRIAATGQSFTSSVYQISGQAILTLIVEPWRNPPNGPASFILTGWFLACLILQCLYSSNLIACFSIPEIQKPVDTFEDARRLKKVVVVKEGSTPSLFLNEDSQEATIKTVLTNDENGVKALGDLKKVATHDRLIIRHKIISEGRKISEFHISKKPFLNIFAGWLYAKDFKFKDAFNLAIIRVAETGLIQKWTEDQFDGSVKDSIQAQVESNANPREYSFRALAMEHLDAVFDFWILGTTLSVIVFVFEAVIHTIATHFCYKPVQSKQEVQFQYLD